MAHTEHHGAHAHGKSAGYETTDASLGGVERFMIVVALFLAACFGIVWLLQSRLASREAAIDVQPSPVVARQGNRLPPLPRLQTRPNLDLAAFRQTETLALERWAWVDRDRGVVQMPIARAIEILAERGLPVPPPAAGPTAPGAAAPATPQPATAVPVPVR